MHKQNENHHWTPKCSQLEYWKIEEDGRLLEIWSIYSLKRDLWSWSVGLSSRERSSDHTPGIPKAVIIPRTRHNWGLLTRKFQKFRFRKSKLKMKCVSLVYFWICVSRPKLSLQKHYNCEKQTRENPAFSELFLRAACFTLLLEWKTVNVPRLKCVSVNVFLKRHG